MNGGTRMKGAGKPDPGCFRKIYQAVKYGFLFPAYLFPFIILFFFRFFFLFLFVYA